MSAGHNHSNQDKDFFFKVEGIHCESCVGKITRALEESRLCENQWVDRATNVLRVRKGHVGVSDSDFEKEILGLLKKLGYKSVVMADPSESGKNEWVLQLFYSASGLLLSYFVIPHESVPFPQSDLLWLLLVVVLFGLSFKNFIRGAWSSLKSWNFTVDTLVSLGAGAAFYLSMTLIVWQIPGHLYWVEAFSILFLVSLGHYIENYVLVRADKTLRSLMVLVPPKAHRVVGMGTVEEVLVSELKIGDTLLVHPGDRVSVDGKITEGRSDFDESLLTGESNPLSKGVGDMVFSGTTNLSGNVKFSVQKLGKDMLLSQIIDTVVRVRQTRADIQKFADRVSNVFVPIVVCLATLSFLLWFFAPEMMHSASQSFGSLFGFSFHDQVEQGALWTGFSAALGVLVISCPCAMGLATPAALMAVSGIAAKRGILIRDGRAIENAEKITHVFFDKTGTLSSAKPKLVNEWKLPAFDANFLQSVSSQSKHPMSRMLAEHGPKSKLTASIREFPGEGIQAQIQGLHTQVEVLMGHAGLIQRMEVKGLSVAQDFVMQELEQGRSLVYWAQNGVLVAVFSFEDELREGVVGLLENFGKDLQVRILSGDNKKVLANLAQKLGLPLSSAMGELTPLDKVHVLQSYQKDSSSKVAFIGDGLNDAPVLQAADLGIAVSSASDLAKQSADIVLLTQDIDAIFEAFQLAKRGMKTIRQNLIWAFAYNVIAIPLAFMGLISPVLCTLSMAASDLVIIVNSLRVFLMKKP
ncbi:MAG: cation-translocating P-type ATPase [Bdellovibrionota bacterium]